MSMEAGDNTSVRSARLLVQVQHESFIKSYVVMADRAITVGLQAPGTELIVPPPPTRGGGSCMGAFPLQLGGLGSAARFPEI